MQRKGDALAVTQAGNKPCGKGPENPGRQRAEHESLTAEMIDSRDDQQHRPSISIAKRLREAIVPSLLLARPHP